MDYDDIMMALGVEHKCLELDRADDEAAFAGLHAGGNADGLLDIMFRISRRSQMIAALEMAMQCGTMPLLVALHEEVGIALDSGKYDGESKIKRDGLVYVRDFLTGRFNQGESK